MSFEEMLAASEAKPLYAGKIVKAKVISVSPTECVVGIDGSKHTGVVTLREMSHDPNAKMEDLVKVDDELDLVVVKTNDQEGVDTLSRVRFEAQKGMRMFPRLLKTAPLWKVTLWKPTRAALLSTSRAFVCLFPVLRLPCAAIGLHQAGWPAR